MNSTGMAWGRWARRVGVGTAAAFVSMAAAIAPADAPGMRHSTAARAEAAAAAVNAAAASSNSLKPFFTATGAIYASVDGGASNAASHLIDVDKRRAGSVVRKAFVLVASTGDRGYAPGDSDLLIAGSAVDVDEATLTASSINSFNVLADVTAIVKPLVDAAQPGRLQLQVSEIQPTLIDGEVLVVVFDDAAEAQGSVLLFFGAQSTSGDAFNILLAESLAQADDGQQLRFSLGIAFGFQSLDVTSQFSQIDINGVRLSSAAGGQDDGADFDGQLITVGGLDDLPDNPADPLATPELCAEPPRCDDELYDLKAVLAEGTTNIRVDTLNPSDDDNIFFAAIEAIGVAALVGEGVLVSPADTTLNTGEPHTIVASVQNDDGQALADKSVVFTVTSGPNQGKTETAISDAAGAARFSYTSATAGTDLVVASIVDSDGAAQTSNDAIVNWQELPATVSLAADTFRVAENAGTAQITLLRSGGTSSAVSVEISSNDISASAGADYQVLSQVVEFAPGETSKTVELVVLDDTIDEADETLGLILRNQAVSAQLQSQPPAKAKRAAAKPSPQAVAQAVAEPSTATLTIVDDDAPTSIAFTLAQSAASEGGEPLSVGVLLSGASSQTVCAALSIGGSARGGEDFDALPERICFEPGSSSQALSIALIDDAIDEGEESIVLTLSAPESATLGAQTTHTVLIAPSDTVVVVPPPVNPPVAPPVTPPVAPPVAPPVSLPAVEVTKTSGGGALNPALLLVLAPLAALRRRRRIAVALLALCSAPTGAAAPGDWYAGAQIGAGESAFGGDDLARHLQARGHAVSADIDRHDRIASLYIGRRVDAHASLEVGLLDFGQYRASVAGNADPEQLKRDLMKTFPVGGYGVSASLRYELPLIAGRLLLMPRFGGFVWAGDNDIEFADGSRDDDKRHGVGVKLDAALVYRFTPRFNLGIGGGLLRPSSDGVIRQAFAQLEVGF